ncbi:LysR substrate-binding domain-containing protein [Xinfangfangia pollutisoli]|uniref:LysR substrate-binding domain-containing protein n=1 Tax=Xinfangfangia pollutisoli TaxID=2865960 RepID=UPI001CD4221E|nr:LysR substrate-binding domain-containing protein [Xinfangfangia pollutisoli]
MNPFDWRALPPLPSLRAFEAAARLGSFSAAARVLNVTHPAVAQQVRALERHLGVRLVAEAARRLRLTDAGERLAAALNAGFAGMAEALERARRADRNRGLRITTTPGFAQSVLLPILSGFWADHPDIPVSLVPDSRPADLAREGFDLAIRAGTPPWPGTEAELLFRCGMVLVGTPELIARSPDPARLPWILSKDDPLEAAWLAGRGLDPARLNAVHLENAMLAMSACLRGMGVLFATEVIMRESIASGALQVLPGWDLPEVTYWTVIPEGERRAPVAEFVAWLKQRL